MLGRDLRRPFRGVRSAAGLAAGTGPDADEMRAFRRRCAAAELIMPAGAFFTHVTAARLLGLPMPAWAQQQDLHIAVRHPQRALRGRGVVGHTCVDPLVVVVSCDGQPIADPATIFLQVAAMLPPPDLIAVGDALVLTPVVPYVFDDQPWVALGELRERVQRFHGRGKRAATVALDRVRAGAESRPETLLRLAIVDAGLPEPDVNVTVHDERGRFVGRGDLVYQDFRVVVEYDGDQHRVDTTQFDRDLGRLDDFAAAGWRVVRVSGRSFFGERERVILRVARALEAAGWQPTDRGAPNRP